MKITERKRAVKDNDILVSVARSIGSALGAVAAKVNGSPRAARQRAAGPKRARRKKPATRNSR